MRGLFGTTCALFLVFLLLTKTHAQEDLEEEVDANCAISQSGCPYGTDSEIPVDEQLCYKVIRFFTIMYGQCRPYTGESLVFTYLGYYISSMDTLCNNTCPTYDYDSIVYDCLPQNDSLTSNLCMSWFAVAYFLRNNCTDYYTIDPCEIPPIGQQDINHYSDTANECTPAPYYDDGQISTTSPAEDCPYCVIASCPIKGTGP